MRNTRDVHGRVRRLCRLYFTLCPVRKRIISSLLTRGGGGCSFPMAVSVFLSGNGHETVRETETWRDETKGQQGGEGEVSGMLHFSQGRLCSLLSDVISR